jgi:hypothetical protein
MPGRVDEKPRIEEAERTDSWKEADFDAFRYYDEAAGRLVVSPEWVPCLCHVECKLISVHALREARSEFGPEVAAKLKLSRDGTKVLWPQPTDDSRDPMNVCYHILSVSYH